MSTFTDIHGSCTTANSNSGVSRKEHRFMQRHKNRVKYSGKGSSNPVAPNETELGRQKNRRVEFIISNP